MYNVLLVDDEEIFLEYMQNTFDWKRHQCQICACLNDGQSALEYISAHPVDVVFIDISMPRMNGLEVCERLAGAPDAPAFVITTAYDEFSFAYRAIKLGIADYLLKPFTTEELETALSKILGEMETNHAEIAEKEEKPEENMSLIGRIDAYLEQHYTEAGLTVARIAKDLRFENSYLRRIYKRSSGITISERLEELRMQHARKLLTDTKLLNSEIAAACGFSDQYYFSRRFKQLCGCTPTPTAARRCRSNRHSRRMEALFGGLFCLRRISISRHDCP